MRTVLAAIVAAAVAIGVSSLGRSDPPTLVGASAVEDTGGSLGEVVEIISGKNGRSWIVVHGEDGSEAGAEVSKAALSLAQAGGASAGASKGEDPAETRAARTEAERPREATEPASSVAASGDATDGAASSWAGAAVMNPSGALIGEIQEVIEGENGDLRVVIVPDGGRAGASEQVAGSAKPAVEAAHSPADDGGDGQRQVTADAEAATDVDVERQASADGRDAGGESAGGGADGGAEQPRFTGLAEDAGALSAGRGEYNSGWGASLEQWGDAVADRAGDLEAEAEGELREAWSAVGEAWDTMQDETDENWTRARTAFEAAFEAFEESWAESVEQSG